MSRAFKSIDNQITSGSDYTRSIRNKAIYLSIERKVRKSEKAAESVSKYDSDYNIMWCAGGNGIPNSDIGFTTAKLKSASSYEAYMNIARGKRIANPVLNGATASKFNIFTGNFAMVHPQTPNPLLVPTKWNPHTKTICPIPIISSPPAIDASQANTIPFPNMGQTSMALDLSWNENNYPGWFFDPYSVLSNYACIKSQAPNLGRKLVNQVEIIYRWSPAYWRSVAGQSLSGVAFPESVTFGPQPTENNELTKRYGPVASLTTQENITGESSAERHDLNQLQSWCVQKGNDEKAT